MEDKRLQEAISNVKFKSFVFAFCIGLLSCFAVGIKLDNMALFTLPLWVGMVTASVYFVFWVLITISIARAIRVTSRTECSDAEKTAVIGSAKRIAGIFVAMVGIAITAFFCYCWVERVGIEIDQAAKQAEATNAAQTEDDEHEASTKNDTSSEPSFQFDRNNSRASSQSEVDPIWPTTVPEIQAIPEEDRWYTAPSRVGTTGTISGPVASVHQVKSSPGMPVFINIGNPYPDPNRVQIVIWAELVPEFEDMLHDIDHGGAWISFTGYISEYEGVAQIDASEGYVEWRWWTNAW